MAELFLVRRGIIRALDKNPETGKYGSRGIKAAWTQLCCCLANVDNVHNSLANDLHVAWKGECMEYEQSQVFPAR